MNLEWLLFSLLIALAVFWLWRPRAARRGSRILASILLGISAVSALAWHFTTQDQLRSAAQLRRMIPSQDRPELDGYVSSDKCQSCHPNEYASWHRTYHRTMTQAASPQSVLGDFNDVTLELQGKQYRLKRTGEEFWVEMEDPEWNLVAQATQNKAFTPPGPPPRVNKRVGLLTGSHHMQVYWIPSQAGNLQHIFPFAWLNEEQRWVPFHDTFLRDPQKPLTPHLWNLNCINCHSTGGQPRPDHATQTLATRTGELGIACEACHGTAREHVKAHQSPLQRYAAHRAEEPDPTIVNPEKLNAHLSSQVCGQCHSIKWITSRDDWLRNGFHFRPGLDMSATINPTPVVRPAQLETQPWLAAPLQQNPTFLEERYWPDGMVRVSGREYNGLIESPCFQGGKFSCLSCHSMHASHPNDQLRPSLTGNQACLQCHSDLSVEQHTRHRPGSSGSSCYNCHMPHTTYGLLKAIRSHQIDSPTVQSSVQTGRPNACNLCHLDKPLAWSARYLSEWYEQPPVPVSEDEENISATLLWLLKGDAGQRALAAWSMGWAPAQETSGRHWLAPFLAQLLEDPYSAVRYIAGRSLRSLGPEYQNLEFDFVGTPEHFNQARQRALEIWRQSMAAASASFSPAVLIESDGKLQSHQLERLLQQRNDRSMDLQE